MPQPGPMEYKQKQESKMNFKEMGSRLQRRYDMLETRIKKVQKKEYDTGDNYAREIAKLKEQQQALLNELHPK
jgi:hypothetical protein